MTASLEENYVLTSHSTKCSVTQIRRKTGPEDLLDRNEVKVGDLVNLRKMHRLFVDNDVAGAGGCGWGFFEGDRIFLCDQ
jgi:hypothetical protein